MGLCNLDLVDDAIASRKRLYEKYVDCLSGLSLRFQKVVASKYNYSYMPVLFETERERDSVYSLLLEEGIKSRKYFYPLTVNFDYFKASGVNLVEKFGLINANMVANRILCLPLYPKLEESLVENVASLIKRNHDQYF